MESSELPSLDALQVVVGLSAVPVVAVGALLSRRFTVLLVGILLFVSAIGVARDWLGVIIGSWILPLQQSRNAVFAALSILLLAGGVARMSGSTIRRVSFISMLLLAIGVYQGLVRVAHEGPAAGAISVAFACATIVPIALVLPSLVRRHADFGVFSHIVATGIGLFALACVVQAALDPSRLTTGLQDRFIGVAANPQHVAVLAAGAMVFAAWRIWGDPLRGGLPFWIALFCTCGVAILLAGSRTGIVMASIGVAALGYRRLGRVVLIVPALALLAALAIQIADFLGVDLPLARLSEGGDTRSEAWSALLAGFASSPVIGVGMSDLEKSENSFLYAAASFGIGMLVLTVALAIAMIVQCVAVLRAAQPYRRLRPIADLVVGFHLAYLFGANLEGYIMSRNSAMMVMLLLAAAIGAVLVDAVREVEATGDPELALAWGMDEAALELDPDGDLAEDADEQGDDLHGPHAP